MSRSSQSVKYMRYTNLHEEGDRQPRVAPGSQHLELVEVKSLALRAQRGRQIVAASRSCTKASEASYQCWRVPGESDARRGQCSSVDA